MHCIGECPCLQRRPSSEYTFLTCMQPWLGDIIAELLTRAQELGLASQGVAQLMGGLRGGLAVNEGQAWRDSFAILQSALGAHLSALLRIHQVPPLSPFLLQTSEHSKPAPSRTLRHTSYPLLSLKIRASSFAAHITRYQGCFRTSPVALGLPL